MIVYKLFDSRKDGIHSLFIDKSKPLPIGKWMDAEFHPTKGFAARFGWHCCFTPKAPHLNLQLADGRRRVWAKCEVPDGMYKTYDRPESQGGAWILADRIRILEVMEGYAGITKEVWSA